MRFGESVLDAIGDANAVEDMRPKEAPAGPIAVFGQVSEGHTIVGQDGVDLIGKDLHHGLEEGGTFHFPGAFVKLDIGELGDSIDSQEHHEPAVSVAQFAAIDVDVADFVGFESLAFSVVFSTGRREMP